MIFLVFDAGVPCPTKQFSTDTFVHNFILTVPTVGQLDEDLPTDIADSPDNADALDSGGQDGTTRKRWE